MIRKRLMIDANKVLERADEVTFMGFKAEERKRHFLELVSSILEQCSPVDAVEVVRCCSCEKHDHDGATGYCNRWEKWTKMSDFCSYGERKDNG